MDKFQGINENLKLEQKKCVAIFNLPHLDIKIFFEA